MLEICRRRRGAAARRRSLAVPYATALTIAFSTGLGDAPSCAHAAPAPAWISEASFPVLDAGVVWETDAAATPVQFQQSLAPQVEAGSQVALPAAARSSQLFTSFGVRSPSLATVAAAPSGATLVTGQESTIRASTDMGDLLGGSAAVLDLGVQRRNPIVNDPRVNGSQVGSLAASGSYWVPARIDLDTMVSKIDSRLVDRATVIAGPYSALYGPGKQFIDFELLATPRTDGGFAAHGASNVDYRSNGEQWYGRQSAWGGDDVWGFRVGYGHRTGNDYEDGGGTLIPGSYKSRDIDLALGAQVTPTGVFEGHALRLDQTDVELAGQAFDIDWLVTDGYEFEYTIDGAAWADRVAVDAWYNRTRFEGSAQRPSKRRQFPFYNSIDFVGATDVDSMSTGYRFINHWDGADDERLSAGADLRFVKQDLNEITSGRRGFAIFTDANSPIPRSDWTNPGLFVEASAPATERVAATAGARIDYAGTRVLDGPAELAALGVQSRLAPATPLSAADIWGSDDLQENDLLGLAYLAIDVEATEGWTVGGKVGYSERGPNLTERYAVEPFMDLIQNGLNTITGDPELDKERLLQTDVRLAGTAGDFRGEVGGFYSWINDYVTYEALSVATGPPNGQIEQVNLKFVNTDLATLWGCQARAEFDWNECLTPFATLNYVQGTDRSRNGAFATQQATAGSPSVRIDGADRGSLSNNGVVAGDVEPLPSILPLESRLGVRLEERSKSAMGWGVELSARVVDRQNRVAASLLETPTAGFTVWDMRAFVRPSDDWQVVAGIENFTDKQYREHLDYRSQNPLALSTNRAGLSVYVGTELKY